MKGVTSVKALRTHVAGVDVHKDMLAITVMIGKGDEDPKLEHFECGTMTDDLRAMGVVLKEKGVTSVAMESTGVYWSRHEAERRSCS
jgi:hypothetical protein